MPAPVTAWLRNLFSFNLCVSKIGSIFVLAKYLVPTWWIYQFIPAGIIHFVLCNSISRFSASLIMVLILHKKSFDRVFATDQNKLLISFMPKYHFTSEMLLRRKSTTIVFMIVLAHARMVPVVISYVTSKQKYKCVSKFSVS